MVSGPAQAPRPPSSMPTTTSWPSAHSPRPKASEGAFPCRARRIFGRGRVAVERAGTTPNMPPPRGRPMADPEAKGDRGRDPGTRVEVRDGFEGLWHKGYVVE